MVQNNQYKNVLTVAVVADFDEDDMMASLVAVADEVNVLAQNVGHSSSSFQSIREFLSFVSPSDSQL